MKKVVIPSIDQITALVIIKEGEMGGAFRKMGGMINKYTFKSEVLERRDHL
jgi:hypothetical protein